MLENTKEIKMFRQIMGQFNYSENVNPAALQLLDQFIAQSQQSIRVLEFGCWTGALGEYCQATFGQCIHEWIGVEAYHEALTIAKKRLSQVIQFDLNEDFDSDIVEMLERADVLLMIDVLEHLYNPFLFLSTIAKHFKRKPVIVVLPNIACHQIIEQLVIQDFKYQDSGILDKTHRYFFTPKSFVRIATNMGFQLRSDIIYLRNATGTEVRSKLMASEKNSISLRSNIQISLTSQADIDSMSAFGFGLIVSAL